MISNFLSHFSPVSAIKNIGLVVWERRCIFCNAVHQDNSPLCLNCREEITCIPAGMCINSLADLTHDTPGNSISLPIDEENSSHFSRLYSFALYEGIIRDMITGWKFNGNLGYNSALRWMIAELCNHIPENSIPDLIVPVPLHPRRLLKRGFNQSLILAKAAASATGAAFSGNALSRIRATIPQSTLSAPERKENLLQAFTAEISIVSGKNVLLVDDVFTTGSTLEECSKTLREAGAVRIEVMTLARALI